MLVALSKSHVIILIKILKHETVLCTWIEFTWKINKEYVGYIRNIRKHIIYTVKIKYLDFESGCFNNCSKKNIININIKKKLVKIKKRKYFKYEKNGCNGRQCLILNFSYKSWKR